MSEAATAFGVQAVEFAMLSVLAAPRAPWLVLGVAFPLIAGLAPLVADNPLMPMWVRVPHAVEIICSNCVFGVFLAWLIMPRAHSARTGSGAQQHEPA